MGACRYKSQFEPVVSNTTGQMVQFRCCSRLRVSHGQNDGIYTSCKMTGGPVNGRPYYSCASRGSYDGAVMWRKDLRQWEFKAAKGSFPFHEFYHLDVVSDVDSLCPPYQIFSAFKKASGNKYMNGVSIACEVIEGNKQGKGSSDTDRSSAGSFRPRIGLRILKREIFASRRM